MLSFQGVMKFVIVVVVSIFYNANSVRSVVRWSGWNRYTPNDGFLPVSGGYKPDMKSESREQCAEICRQDTNCTGFVFVSDTSLCQLHSEVWGVGDGVLIENSASYYTRYGCPLGWSAFGDSCYLIITSQYNYTDAETTCNRQGASLVQIGNPIENDFVTQLCKDNTVEKAGIHCWMAAMKPDVNDEWVFPVSGELVVYFRWRSGEPNRGFPSTCIVINAGTSYMWTDDPCYWEVFPICEKKN